MTFTRSIRTFTTSSLRFRCKNVCSSSAPLTSTSAIIAPPRSSIPSNFPTFTSSLPSNNNSNIFLTRSFATKPNTQSKVKDDDYTTAKETTAPVSDYYFYSQDPFKAFEERNNAMVKSKHPGIPNLPPPFYSTATRSQSRARLQNIRITPKKLNEMCRLVRGLGVDEAIIQMKHFGKLRAKYLITGINYAIRTAVDQYNMDRSRLYVAQALVNRSGDRKGYRIDHKARGRYGIIKCKWSRLVVILQEQPLVVPDANGKLPKLAGQRNPYWGKSHKHGVEVRIGRHGRTYSAIERTSRMMAEYKAAKKRMGLDKEPLPLPSRYAEMVLP